jgi:diguanylate cyclase (GGDEF)-like protein/excisionase family DNA binding protein/putative nucleotidyltransferase with HDIG domain
MTGPKEREDPTWLRVSDVARLLGVSANTVRRWTDAERIAAHRSPGGHRRYLAADVMALLPHDGDGGAHPGDLAELRRQSQDLRAVLRAGLELTALLVEAPREVPERVARRICELTGAPRCDVLERDGARLRLTVSIDGGELDQSRAGSSFDLAEWAPVTDPLTDHEAAVVQIGERGLDQRGRRALQRRGCRSLLWAPLVIRGELIGAIEATDARVNDLASQADIVTGLACICAEALAIEATYDDLARRDKALAELMRISEEVAETHDLEHFAERFALRLLTVVNADCVTIYGVSSGVIRLLLDVRRDGGVDRTNAGRLLDTANYPSLEQLLLDYTPLAVADLSDPRLAPHEVDFYREWGYASSLTMPLVAGGSIVGLVDIYDDAERDWSLDLEFLTGVMQLVAGVFDNAGLMSEVQEQSRLQHELLSLAGRLATPGSLDELAAEAARRLRDVTGAADCDVWWREEGYLRCLASVDADGLDATVQGKTLEIARFPSTKRLLDEREILVVSSLGDPRITEFEREDLSEYGFKSMISLPLVTQGETVGMIDIFDTRERDFVEVRELVTTAARTIADSMQSAALLGVLRRSNAALSELVLLGDQLNEAEGLTALARIAAERLRSILQAEDCDIWTIEGERMRCLASLDSRGWDEEEIGSERDLRAFATTQEALAANVPQVFGDLAVADLAEAEMAAYRRWGFRSMVSLPLVAGGRSIGLIDIFDTRVRDYTSSLDFIRGAGRLLTGAFEKAMLVERLESGNRDLRVLTEAGIEFGATLDVDAVLGKVAQRILDVAASDLCDIYGLVDDEPAAEVLLSLGREELVDSVGRRYALGDFGTFTEAAETGQPVIRLDVVNDPRSTVTDREDARAWGYTSIMTVPLIAGGDLIGFVEVYNIEQRPFAREEVILGLAQVAGQAINNARLYRQLDESVRWMTLMSESALELSSSLDLRDTLLATARRLCASVGVPECEITVVEGAGLRTIMRVEHGKVDEEWIGQFLTLADAAVTREVIETKRPTVVASLRDPRLTAKVHEINQGYEKKSWATLPLVVEDRVIGTVELVESAAERSFTSSELETAAAICHAAAMAIENAALFEREQAANQESLLLNEIARRTAASLDLEEIVHAATDELRKLMPFDTHALLIVENGLVAKVISPDPRMTSLASAGVEGFGRRFLDELREQRVVVLRDTDAASRPAGHPLLPGLRCAVSIALLSEGEIIGALQLASSSDDAFAALDTRLLERVATQLSLAIKNARLYDEIKQMHLGNLKALSSALNAKDYYTLGHAARVAAYMVMLTRELGWPEEVLSQLEEAAYLHDIGKISISDRVLLKAGRLNPQEWEQMRQHPVFSAEIIRPLFPDELVKAVRHHHEQYDGSGYPEGLSGDDIPPLARIMAVVDAYDAMSCRRPYKTALSYPECLAELERCRGTQFDPLMVDAFLHVLEDIARRRARAEEIAAQAAAAIPGDKHVKLRSRDDEVTPEYLEIAATLRAVRDANPPTRFLTTHAQIDKKYVIGVDPEESAAEKSHFGDEIFADDELPIVLAGERPHVNTVFADEFGVWVTGLAPIRDSRGNVVGAVAADLPALGAVESESLRSDGRQTFAAMLQSAAVRLSRAEIDSITDALTGLYNHRYLQERLSEELLRARELGQPLSMLFCDLDHFKGYNDANGHSAGDVVLREVAHMIEQSVRNVDVAGRYGGEEFVVLLVETGREQALAIAERIRERIRAAGFSAHGTPLSVSIGVAGFPEDSGRREELLDMADRAMYLAKQRGRDQVASAGES